MEPSWVVWRGLFNIPNFTPIHPPKQNFRQNTPETHLFQKHTYITPFHKHKLPPILDPTKNPSICPTTTPPHTWDIRPPCLPHRLHCARHLIMEAVSHLRVHQLLSPSETDTDGTMLGGRGSRTVLGPPPPIPMPTTAPAP